MKIKPTPVIPVLTGLSLVASQAIAGDMPFEQCPQTVDIQQTIKSSIEGGWKIAINEGPLVLEMIGISSDEFPVEQTGFDAPEERKIFPNRGAVSYYNVHGAEGLYKYWAVCRYLGATLYLGELNFEVQHIFQTKR